MEVLAGLGDLRSMPLTDELDDRLRGGLRMDGGVFMWGTAGEAVAFCIWDVRCFTGGVASRASTLEAADSRFFCLEMGESYICLY